MRILTEVTDQQSEALAEIAAARGGPPRAELIREALDAYIAEHRKPITAYFGAWSGKVADPDQFLADMRAEWDGR